MKIESDIITLQETHVDNREHKMHRAKILRYKILSQTSTSP